MAQKETKANLPARQVQKFWNSLGPGLTTGAADDDPSGIATYSQAGASFGFNFLWTALFTFPFMALVQEMCARIGIVTGRGLAGIIARTYPRWIILSVATLLFAANTFNLAADLGIMAKAVQLILPINFEILIIGIAALILYLQIKTTYKTYSKGLKWLTLILLSYVLTGLIIDINWSEAMRRLVVPHVAFNKDSLILLTAILGTTISPYLFFWQTSQEVEEEIMDGKTSVKDRSATTPPSEIKKMRVDVWSGMFLSNLVMFFIIAVCASTLFPEGIVEIKDAAQAAEALRPLAGNAAYFLFTLGIVGTGLLTIPILAGSSSYAIAESFGWREGLYRKFNQAHAFYGVIILSMLIGLAINFLHIDVIKMLIYAAVFNGIIAPLILALIVLIASNKKIMKEWTNKPHTTFLGWTITGVMGIASLLTIWYLITG